MGNGKIDLSAQGKLYGCLSVDGRFLEFRKRGKIVVFDVLASVVAGRGVVASVRMEEGRVGLLTDERARTE